jgi:hypothetical protein
METTREWPESLTSLGHSLEPVTSNLKPQLLSGGAGNRTPVREEIDHSLYVRSPLLSVSTRWPADGRRMDEPSLLSPADRRRIGGLAQICDTHGAAPGGLPRGHSA